MVKVLITDGLDKASIETLKNDGYEVAEKFYKSEELGEVLKNYDVLVVRSTTKVRESIIDKAAEAGKLKLIIRGGVGVDNIDVAYAESKGIAVRNTPQSSSSSVAELVIAHMLALSRFLYMSNVSMREEKWEKKAYEGVEINGKTLGLVGFGRIAREVAKRAYALGMKVLYTDLIGRVDGFNEYGYCKLEELLRNSDFVSLHIPYDQTVGPVIGKDEIEIMKDGAYLINCARGGVVSEGALLEALDIGKLSGAGIDVFEEEPTKNKTLIQHPKVSVTPHIGASTIEAQARIGKEVVSIIKESFEYI